MFFWVFNPPYMNKKPKAFEEHMAYEVRDFVQQRHKVYYHKKGAIAITLSHLFTFSINYYPAVGGVGLSAAAATPSLLAKISAKYCLPLFNTAKILV